MYKYFFLCFILGIIIYYVWWLKSRRVFKRITNNVIKCENNHEINCETIVQKKINNIPNPIGIFSTSLYIPKNKELTDSFITRYMVPITSNLDYLKNTESPFYNWALRIYISPLIFESEIFKKKIGIFHPNIQIYIMDKESKEYEGSLWRFLAAEEKKSVLFIDSDDEIQSFGKKYNIEVNKWLKSNNPFYRRKLPFITLFIPISAGCWGSRGEGISNIQYLISKYLNKEFGSDEAFLKKEVYPLFKEKGFYSDSFTFEYSIILLIILLLIIYFYRINSGKK